MEKEELDKWFDQQLIWVDGDCEHYKIIRLLKEYIDERFNEIENQIEKIQKQIEEIPKENAL